MKTNVGNDGQADCMAGGLAGVTGTTTSSPTSTTVTDSGASFGALTGKIVAMGGVYGVIVSNTGTVLTIDRWYNPATPGGTAGTTPSSGTYLVLPGAAPFMFMAITANSSAPSASDTTLSGEITTSGGGLVRKLATYAHTTGAASYSLAATFTANGSDSLPVTLAKIGIFNSLLSGRMQFETLLSATATLSASGDFVTCTDTVSL